jgi:predicted Zn finger-like uncharacterized protein
MKITCQSCQSKYTIADDKVLGKVVKIKCKKCAATIFVNGSDGSTSVGSDTDNEPLSRYRAEKVPEDWTVNVAEGQQKTMTDDQVVVAFQAGTINAETFLWKDGMPDWVPLRDAGELFRSCTASTATAAPSTAAKRGPAPQAFGEHAASLAQSSYQDAGAAATSNGFSVGFPQAAAARRGGGRAAGVDLFGGVAQAGGEADVVTSAPAKIPQAHEAPQKATGARNENSVLFSLSAMTSKSSSEPPPRQHGDEASGLIDIRQLSAQIGIEDKKQSRVDDIMNLSGGGAFSPTLMAPTLSAPAFEAYAPDSSGDGASPAHGRNKGVILLALGASACVVVAAVGGAYFWMRGAPSVDTETPSSSASVAPSVAAPSASVAMAAPPSTTEAPAANAVAPAASAASPEASAKPVASDTKTTVSAPAARESPSPPVARPTAAPAVEAGPFNMGEARARLGAAAAAAAGCKKAGGPTGTGRVVVLFAPSGGTQSATVSGPPFEATPTGACVAARFRAVRVPSFSGSPFSVSKSFTIN